MQESRVWSLGREDPRVRKIPWRREWLPTSVFLPGEFHEQRSLVGYNPWGLKKSDTTEQPTLFTFMICLVALIKSGDIYWLIFLYLSSWKCLPLNYSWKISLWCLFLSSTIKMMVHPKWLRKEAKLRWRMISFFLFFLKEADFLKKLTLIYWTFWNLNIRGKSSQIQAH